MFEKWYDFALWLLVAKLNLWPIILAVVLGGRTLVGCLSASFAGVGLGLIAYTQFTLTLTAFEVGTLRDSAIYGAVVGIGVWLVKRIVYWLREQSLRSVLRTASHSVAFGAIFAGLITLLAWAKLGSELWGAGAYHELVWLNIANMFVVGCIVGLSGKGNPVRTAICFALAFYVWRRPPVTIIAMLKFAPDDMVAETVIFWIIGALGWAMIGALIGVAWRWMKSRQVTASADGRN